MAKWLLMVLLATGMAGQVLASSASLTLVAVGDVNMNRHRTEVREDGMNLWGKVVPFTQPLEKIREHLKGDLVFGNLETVVTDRNDIPPSDKTYNFKMHPNGVRELMKSGFNLFALGNNHVIDYGDEGIRETLKWMKTLAGKKKKKLWYAGAGLNLDQASEPAIFTINGIRIAFGSVSISKPATAKRGGVVSVHKPDTALQKLKDADVDLRILSMHAGEERNSTPAAVQFRTARTAISKYKVNVVLGHHAHVVQGIELYEGGLILYGLGNFSMRGARNMGSVPEFRGVRDFGLLARIRLEMDKKTREIRFAGVSALPVYDMHSGVRPFRKTEDAQARIEALNRLSGASHLGKKSNGLTFQFKDGWGRWLPPSE